MIDPKLDQPSGFSIFMRKTRSGFILLLFLCGDFEIKVSLQSSRKWTVRQKCVHLEGEIGQQCLLFLTDLRCDKTQRLSQVVRRRCPAGIHS